MHASITQRKHKDTLTKKTQGHTDQEQNRQNTHFTAALLVLSLDCSQAPPAHPQPTPPRPDTNKHACKQTGRPANRAYTHTNCAYQGPGMTESVPAVLSPGKPSQDKPDGGWRGPHCGCSSSKLKPPTAETSERVKMSQRLDRCCTQQLARAGLHQHVPLLSEKHANNPVLVFLREPRAVG